MNEFAPKSGSSRKILVLSLLGLSAFLAVEALLLRHYIAVDKRPPSWDQATHMEIALDYREALGAGRWSDMWFLAPKPGMPPFPPAYHLLLRSAFASADPAHAALWINWFYMAILALSLFGISWRFMPNSRALAATLAFCAAPGLQDLLTTQLVDLAMVALVSASYWVLLESEGFTGWLPALGFGFLHAAGMMHKWSFFSYMLPAYVVAARALGDRTARVKVVAAVALSLALSAPWYWSHLALLPARLVQASSDFATPFWKDNAWAAYLRQACASLGPLLWALGFVSLLSPQYSRRRENGWILGYWALFSYVFWAVVPNRQIRFLLPGLAPLAVAMAATWPRRLTWSVAALQVLGALNFFYGFVGPLVVAMPLQPLTFFVNRPPLADEWRIEDILRRVEAERDPSREIANVTLVANDDYFNGPTFHWVQRRLNLPHVRMRGVNKRLCEFSEFVIVKNGRLGPASVIGGLPEAAKIVNEPDGWFRAAYEQSASWPLPDASTAVLYRQKRRRPRPIDQKRIDYALLQAGGVRARNMRADLGVWDVGTSAWKDVAIGAERLEVRGLAVRDVAVDVKNFSVVPMFEAGAGTNFDWGDVRLMRIDRVVVRALRISADDLKKFVEARVPGLALTDLILDGTVKASGEWRGRRVTAEAALELDRAAHRLRVRILSASYMGLSVPVALFRPIKELDLSLDPNPETPFFIELSGLTIKGGVLTVP